MTGEYLIVKKTLFIFSFKTTFWSNNHNLYLVDYLYELKLICIIENIVHEHMKIL